MGLSGVAGEYYVAAELSRRGFMASIMLRNNDSVDILASNLSGKKIFSVQVKTNQNGKREWILKKKAEEPINSLIYIFVSLKDGLTRPEFFLIPSLELSAIIKNDHIKWLSGIAKSGRTRNDSDMRKFRDYAGAYLEKWDILLSEAYP